MLEGNLVNLKIVERDDMPLLKEWSDNPEFGGEFEPLEQVSLKEMEEWYRTLRSNEKWFIIEKKDGTKIGQIMHIPERHFYTIGFIIVPGERGKGYCTEAVRIMVDFVFLSTPTVRIQAEANPKNVASQKVLEKAGFTREGILRKSFYARGKWLDGIVYSILREEWKEPRILHV